MRVKLHDLWTGDRFVDSHGRLFTRLECVGDGKHVHVRAHCQASLNLAERGYGYIGDSLLTFPLEELVTFQPPTRP